MMNLKGKKILVTGSTGFIGKHLFDELQRQDAEVITLTDRNGCRIDIRDQQIAEKMQKIDLVYHLAAITFVPLSYEKPKETYEVNVMGTLNILDMCRIYDINKIIYSSSYVYGQPQYLPIDEKHPLQPTNPYMRSKIFGEELCKAYNEDFGIKCIILRPFNIYGQGQGKSFLIPSIITQLHNGKLELKDSEPKRDYIYISDVIDAYIKAGEFNGDFDVFNIGYGKSYSVKEIVDKIIQIYGKDINVKYANNRRRNEIMDTVANIKHSKEKLGWKPNIDIDTGLNNIMHIELKK